LILLPSHDNGAPVTLVSATLGHVDLKTQVVWPVSSSNECAPSLTLKKYRGM
jgi:hypothetical protein